MEYILLNKDTPLLKFETGYSLGSVSIKETASFSSLRPLGFKGIADWVDKRDYAKHKAHLTKWLKEWGIDTIDGFLQISHCLGINDTLWVKESGSTLTWKEVSLFRNPFSDIVAKTAFDSGLHGLQLSSTSPEFTCDGSFVKYWEWTENGIYLYKFGSDGFANAGMEPYSEFLASSVSKMIEENSISYDLGWRHNRICSKCQLFTDENEGFVPFYKILEDRHYTIEDILEICTSMGFENEFRKMILVDSVVFNMDRHLGNFGFIVDNDSFQIKRFAPLFDYNMSMYAKAMVFDLDNIKHYEDECHVEHRLGGSFVDVGREILTPSIRKQLPNKITLVQHPKYPMPEERFFKLKKLFEQNYADILNPMKIRTNCSNHKKNEPNEPDV